MTSAVHLLFRVEDLPDPLTIPPPPVPMVRKKPATAVVSELDDSRQLGVVRPNPRNF